MFNNQENQISNTIVNKDQLCRVKMGKKEKDRRCMYWLIGGSLRWLRVMVVQEKLVARASLKNWHASIERTTRLGCRALLSIGLGIRVTT